MPNFPLSDQPEKSPKKLEDIFEMDKKDSSVMPETRERPAETSPEKSIEIKPEAAPKITPEGESARRRYAPVPSAVQSAASQPAKSEELVKIENILSSHLEDIFYSMTPQQRDDFKRQGEATANKIQALLQETKVKVKEILNLIKDWLKMVPGINRFFLEQEAKIKTDRLLNIREQKQK